MRHYDYPTLAQQLSSKNACCTQDNLKPHDCGCRVGCPECWAHYHCATCGALYGPHARRELPELSTSKLQEQEL